MTPDAILKQVPRYRMEVEQLVEELPAADLRIVPDHFGEWVKLSDVEALVAMVKLAEARRPAFVSVPYLVDDVRLRTYLTERLRLLAAVTPVGDRADKLRALLAVRVNELDQLAAYFRVGLR
jgi:hypothetical protein